MPSKPEDEFGSLPSEAGAAGTTGKADSGEFTQMFARPRVPDPSAGAPATEPLAAQPQPGEFTQIFTPLAKPTSTPDILRSAPGAASAPEAKPGDFTQFFSALSARSEPAAQPLPAAAPSRPPAPEPARPTATPAEEPGTFTQLLQQIQAQPAAASVQPEGRLAGGLGAAPARGPQESSPAKPQESSPLFGASPQRPESPDIFRAPQVSRELKPSDAQVFAAPRPSPASAPAESFTDIFQRVAEPPRGTAPPPAPSTRPAPPDPFGPTGLPESSARPGGPGEFTRLMQNLAQPPAAAPLRQEPALPVADAFFNEPAPSHGASEFTRVMRGDVLRAQGVPAPRSSQVGSGSAIAPGLAIAPAPAPGAADAPEKKKKPSRLVILLIVFNVVLVLALVIVAIILVMHRH